ncbi:mitochondrial carrier [Calocera viscosa TUFC12733]|uniref:Mitochondrial carrier n=1 Tax=Calocera viscosa (strain TUFC12733) TaxID=1330018 RepID=A0A167S977_CALVF|nr:mitochondrial carrier [Calocera viscosa TUFC12733]
MAVEDEEYEALPLGVGVGVNMLAGAMAGISEHAVMFPVDSIKTRMQVFSTSPAAVYSGIGNAVARISSTEGLRTLWRGVASVIVGAGPAHALYFGTYEIVKEATGGNRPGHHVASTAWAGACATLAHDALMNPFDVIKQRMQLYGSSYRNVAQCARSVYRNEGMIAFYVSYPTTLMMTVPFTAVQFSTYESMKKFLNPEGTYSPLTHVTAGGIAGGVAGAITTPLDVAKTLLQTRGTSDDIRIRNARGMVDAFKIIWQRNGIWGFARGLTPRVLTYMPSNALCWLCYEFFKVAIGDASRASSHTVAVP